MNIRKLLSIGKKSEKRVSHMLPENLAALFGAEEGQNLEVEATEDGLEAITAAESNLVQLSNDLEAALKDAETEKAKAAESEKALEDAQQTIADQKAKIEELEKGPATNHTAPKSGDTVSNDPEEKPVSEHKRKETEARERAKETAKQVESSK